MHHMVLILQPLLHTQFFSLWISPWLSPQNPSSPTGCLNKQASFLPTLRVLYPPVWGHKDHLRDLEQEACRAQLQSRE